MNENDAIFDDTEEPELGIRKESDRVEAIEAAHPEVKFTRFPDGEVKGWGSVPEQATGTIHGHPFYYRMRYNSATLTVWNSAEVGVEDVPSSFTDVALQSYINEVVPDDDFLGWTEGTEVFERLLGSLAPPDRSGSAVRIEEAEAAGVASFDKVVQAVKDAELEVEAVERPSRYHNDVFGVFRLPSGNFVQLYINTQLFNRDKQEFEPGLIVWLVKGDKNPVAGNPDVSMSSFGELGTGEDVLALLASDELSSSATDHNSFSFDNDDLGTAAARMVAEFRDAFVGK